MLFVMLINSILHICLVSWSFCTSVIWVGRRTLQHFSPCILVHGRPTSRQRAENVSGAALMTCNMIKDTQKRMLRNVCSENGGVHMGKFSSVCIRTLWSYGQIARNVLQRQTVCVPGPVIIASHCKWTSHSRLVYQSLFSLISILCSYCPFPNVYTLLVPKAHVDTARFLFRPLYQMELEFFSQTFDHDS